MVDAPLVSRSSLAAVSPLQGPLALVMAPTRELAQQIEEECTKIAKHTDVRSASVVGGVNIAEQVRLMMLGTLRH